MAINTLKFKLESGTFRFNELKSKYQAKPVEHVTVHWVVFFLALCRTFIHKWCLG